MNISELRKLNGSAVCLGLHPGIIQSMIDYDYLTGCDKPRLVAIIASGRKSMRFFWGEDEIEIPLLPHLGELSLAQRKKINFFLNVQSARRILDSTIDSLELLPNLAIGTIFAEQVPEAHSLKLREVAQSKDVILAGPASVGFLMPGQIKLGAIGGTQPPQIVTAGIMKGGDTAVLSTSGGMVNELIHTVTGSGMGVSFAVALGGDRYPVTSPADGFLMAEADPTTKRIVYFGELGGVDEYEIAKLIKSGKVTKPVIAYIAGTVAELFETPPQFGHAKAMAATDDERALSKQKALRAVKVTVLDTFADLAPTLAKLSKEELDQTPARSIGLRRKRLIASHISGDKAGDIQLLGQDLMSAVRDNSFAGLTLSMLLGKQVKSQKLIEFADYVLRLSVDHGPYVSGAVNTVVAARAGKDLVSSLASGLLTIGPRFGGALNEAANNWLRGASSNQTAKEFVNSQSIIAGIGHKKYRIDLPDPRVKALKKFAKNTNGDRYLKFALSVEAVTTSKKGNLILNVDGAIAAILLDLLESELVYTTKQLEELVDIEFFNALFVLSRSVGFAAHYLDQRRHDEGLLRLTDQDVVHFH